MQGNPVLKRQGKARLSPIERQIAELDAESNKHIADDQNSAGKQQILLSVPGLGPIAAALIIAFCLKLGLWAENKPEALPSLFP